MNSTNQKRTCVNCQQEFELPHGSVCPDDGGMLANIRQDELLGKVLDNRYEILEILGGGGMGVVYKARHNLMKRIVAIKMLHKHVVGDGDALKRFQMEAQASSCLSLPNILTVYDFGVTPEGQPYMVMDYLDGFSLSDLLAKEGHLPVERSINIFLQACVALAHAHEKGVLHRDLKPSNIMLVNFENQKDFVKIVDFGIAKLLTQQSPGAEQLTKTGEVFGSPLYMSPEQCRGKSLDVRSDIYSIGCVMYKTLTGLPVFSGDELIELLFHQMSDTPAPFKEACPTLKIPAELEQIVFKSFAKEPENRYQTMQDLGSALRELQKRITNTAEATLPPMMEGLRQNAFMEALNVAVTNVAVPVGEQSASVSALASATPAAPTEVGGNGTPAVASSAAGPTANAAANPTATTASNPAAAPPSATAPPAVDPAQPAAAATPPRIVPVTPATPAAAPTILTPSRPTPTSSSKSAPYTRAPIQRGSTDSSNLKTIIGLVAAATVIIIGAVMFVQNAQNANKGGFNRGLYSTAIEKARENFDDGKYAQSVSDSTDAIAEARKLGPSDPELGKALNVRAKAYFADRKFDKSEQDFNQALAQTQSIYGDKALQPAEIKAELAGLMLATGRYAQGESLLQQTLAVQQALKAKDADIADTTFKLASAHAHLHRVQLAAEESKRALAVEEKALPPNDPKLAATKQLVESLASPNGAPQINASEKAVPTVISDNVEPQEKSAKPVPTREHTSRRAAAHRAAPVVRRHAYSTYGY